MQINIPEVVAEVAQVFRAYEQALSTNDLDTLDALFWKSPLTLRYGPNGTLVGHEAISSFRRDRNIRGIKRTLRNTVITAFGTDFAVANTESDRSGITSRQSQTWVRMPDGWRIVAAHVSDDLQNETTRANACRARSDQKAWSGWTAPVTSARAKARPSAVDKRIPKRPLSYGVVAAPWGE